MDILLDQHQTQTAYWPAIRDALTNGSLSKHLVNLDCEICYQPLIHKGNTSIFTEQPTVLPCGHIFGNQCLENLMQGAHQQERWQEWTNGLWQYGEVAPTPTCPKCRLRLTFKCESVANECSAKRWPAASTCTANFWLLPFIYDDDLGLPLVPDPPPAELFEGPCMVCNLIYLTRPMKPVLDDSHIELWATNYNLDNQLDRPPPTMTRNGHTTHLNYREGRPLSSVTCWLLTETTRGCEDDWRQLVRHRMKRGDPGPAMPSPWEPAWQTLELLDVHLFFRDRTRPALPPPQGSIQIL